MGIFSLSLGWVGGLAWEVLGLCGVYTVQLGVHRGNEEAKESGWGRQRREKGGCCDIQRQGWGGGRAENREEECLLSPASVNNLPRIQVWESGGTDGDHHTEG